MRAGVMDLIFCLHLEMRKEEMHLYVQVREKNSSRLVYLSDLQEFSKEQKSPRYVALLLQEYKAGGKFSLHEAVRDICLRPSCAAELLPSLFLSSRCLFQGGKIFFNPLSVVKVYVEVEERSTSTLFLSADIEWEGKKVPIVALDMVWGGFGIYKQQALAFPKALFSEFLSLVYPSSSLLEGKRAVDFADDYRKDMPLGVEAVVWKTVEDKNQPDPLPVLILRDAMGLLADLAMEYPGQLVEYRQIKDFPGRLREVERLWEKDLLETDFVIRPREGSYYYCPSDKVAQSLAFLLELGWKIIDRHRNQVVQMTRKEIRGHQVEGGVRIEGCFGHGEWSVDLERMVEAYARKEPFLSLAPGVVALVEEEEVLMDLQGHAFVKGGMVLSPQDQGIWQTIPDLQHLVYTQEIPALSSCFQGCLRPYQEEGRRWLLSLWMQGQGGLLADEMGLGKTVQVLAALSFFTEPTSLLIVAPSSLLFNWKKEWERFLPNQELYVHEGPGRALSLMGKTRILTSYACLRIDQALFRSISFEGVIIDEAQNIKNPDSQIAQVCYGLSARWRLCMTGTPIENRMEDLWSLFRFLHPSLLPDRRDFILRWDTDSGYRRWVRKKVRAIILRRLKAEVVQDLPGKQEQEVLVPMTKAQQELYDRWLVQARQGVLRKARIEGIGAHRMEILETILRLRQICCHPFLVGDPLEESGKYDLVLSDIEEVVSIGKKVLLYSQFTQMLHIFAKAIEQKGWKYAYLDGQTKDKEAQVETFQTDPDTLIFLLSIKAGGVGLNLTAAEYVFLFDPWWNEAVEKQAIDRAHRVGTKHCVVARRYIVAWSVEEKIRKIHAHKAALAQGILSDPLEGQEDVLEELVELLTEN